MPGYIETVSNPPEPISKVFYVADAARRLRAGTGSLGRPRYYILVRGSRQGELDDYRILDVKLQQKPSAFPYLTRHEQDAYNRDFTNDAVRHAAAYRALNKRTDAFLGSLELNGGWYSVRERSPWKEAFPAEVLWTQKALEKMAKQWGRFLAVDHVRAGTEVSEDFPSAVNAKTDGNHKEFREFISDKAKRYAKQVEDDWETFVGALDINVRHPLR